MFTTTCFIHKNTPELRTKLSKLGYKMIGTPDEHEYIQCSNGWVNDLYDITDCSGIDCDKNENLFLALAAMRDDNDNQQIFLDQDGIYFRCGHDSVLEFMELAYVNGYDVYGSFLRKATVEELLNLYN